MPSNTVSVVRVTSPIGPVEIAGRTYKFRVQPAALPGEVVRLWLGGGEYLVEVRVESLGEYGYSVGQRTESCPSRQRFRREQLMLESESGSDS